MKAVVVYESLWGNTAAVARAVAEGLGPGVRALSTAEASGQAMSGIDLIVAGAPVLGFRLPTEAMRESTASNLAGAPKPPDLSHPSMRSWLERMKRLRASLAEVEQTAQVGVPADRAVQWLRALAETWQQADVPAARSDLLHAIDERIVVAGREFVSARLTPAAYAHGLALALPEIVAKARPTGVGPALATRIPIEGRDEWLAAARVKSA